MTCEQIRPWIPVVASGDGGDEAKKMVEGHIVRCNPCAEIYREDIKFMPWLGDKAEDLYRVQRICDLIKREKRSHRFNFSRVASIAAILVLLLGTAVVLTTLFRQEEPVATIVSGNVVIKQNRITTSDEQSGQVKLADQSTIDLAPRTELKVENIDMTRIVQMTNGLAIFDIARNSKNFRVKTPVGEITVIGTKFQISLKEENMKIIMTVIVLAGIVQVGNTIDTVSAAKGETVYVNQDEKPVKNSTPITTGYGQEWRTNSNEVDLSKFAPHPFVIEEEKTWKAVWKKKDVPKADFHSKVILVIWFECEHMMPKGKVITTNVKNGQAMVEINYTDHECNHGKTFDDAIYIKAISRDGIESIRIGNKTIELEKQDYKQLLELHKKICSLPNHGHKFEAKPYYCKLCSKKIGEASVCAECAPNACESCAKKNGICNQCGKNLQQELEKQIRELIKKLDAEEPSDRGKATEKLIELAKLAKDLVKKAVEEHLKETKSAEAKARCEQILKELTRPKEDPKWPKPGVCTDPKKCCSGVHLDIGSPCNRCERMAGHFHALCEFCAKELGACAHCGRKLTPRPQ